MATQLLFSDLMAAAAVVASTSGPTTSSSSSMVNGNNSNCNNSVLMDPSQAAAFYTNGGGNSSTSPSAQSNNANKNYLEDQRALQLAFELSMLNNNGGGASGGGSNGATTDATTNGGSNASSLSTSSSLGHNNGGVAGGGDMGQAFYLNAGSVHQQQRQQTGNVVDGHEYDVLQHFLGAGNHEHVNAAMNNLGAGHHSYHQQQQQQQQHMNYDEIALEKFLLNQNMASSGNGGGGSSGGDDYFNHRNNGHHHLTQHSATTLNNLINGISSINLNNLHGGGGGAHGFSNGNNGGNLGGGNGSNGGMMNETERFKKSQNMTECVPVPSSEHVAEIVGRQGCKIKALRAKTNTYIKTPVRGEEPVFVVTGRKEDVAKAKKEILSAAEHFSLIRASRKPSLTNGGGGGGGGGGGISSMAGSPLLAAATGSSSGGLGDIFSSSSSGDDSPSILTKNPIGLTSAAAAAAAAGHNQITVQVRVPYRVVGLVVGPKGATIKNIQQQTHTYIVTPSRDKEPIFEVTGAVENVEIARQQIEAHIAMRTGGSNEGADNLTNYLNSINSRGGSGMDLGLKKDMQDELQLLNENFGQSTNFLRKYLNGNADDQQDASAYGGSSFLGSTGGDSKQSVANLAAMELLMTQLYNQENQVASGGVIDGLNNVDGNIPSSVDLFGNRIRIDELLQSMQQQQKQQHGVGDSKRDVDLLLGRNLFNEYNASCSGQNGGMKVVQQGGGGGMKTPSMGDYYGSYAGAAEASDTGRGGGGGSYHQMKEDQGVLRRQLLSNNSEDDEGVGLELQESSPPNTSTNINIMKMVMDGTDENKKYLWSTLAAAGNGIANNGGGKGSGGGGGGAEMMSGNANHSSDSSCLSSASPSPTLSKFFTFQNGNASSGNNGGPCNKDRAEVELAAHLM